MARRLKPQKVDEIRHRDFGVTVDLMFDRNPDTLDFFVTLGTETLRNKDAKLLKIEALKLIEHQSSLIWQPVIKLDTGSTGIRIEAERFWWARKMDGTLTKAEWDKETDEERIQWAAGFYWDVKRYGEFTPPVRCRPRFRGDFSHGVYLPYSEEVWRAVEMLQLRLQEVRDRIDELINTEVGNNELQTIGATAIGKLLPASFDV